MSDETKEATVNVKTIVYAAMCVLALVVFYFVGYYRGAVQTRDTSYVSGYRVGYSRGVVDEGSKWLDAYNEMARRQQQCIAGGQRCLVLVRPPEGPGMPHPGSVPLPR